MYPRNSLHARWRTCEWSRYRGNPSYSYRSNDVRRRNGLCFKRVTSPLLASRSCRKPSNRVFLLPAPNPLFQNAVLQTNPPTGRFTPHAERTAPSQSDRAEANSTSRPVAGTLYLGALRVFLLSETSGQRGSHWLESTNILSTVSRITCAECREATGFHVRVGKLTPRSLWLARVPLRLVDGLDTSPACVRVPPVTVAKLTWDLSSADELRLSSDENGWFSSMWGVREMVFGEKFNQSVRDIVWPGGLRELTFGCSFNQAVNGVVWPLGLKRLRFGKSFNKAVDGVAWPRFLEHVTFGQAFAQPCANTGWPATLREITFGQEYNQPLSSESLPPALEQLTLGHKFNRPIDGVVSWPPTLRVLTFGWHFNQSLKGVALPRTLEVLSLAGVYNKPLDDVHLPPGLQKLTLGGHFNQSLTAVLWPDTLQELCFGWAFNQPLNHVDWPLSLTKLALGYRYNQPAEHMKWPEKLESLNFGVFSRQSLRGVVWPPSFQTLTVSRAFDTTGMILPNGAHVCRRGHTCCKVRRTRVKNRHSVVMAV